MENLCNWLHSFLGSLDLPMSLAHAVLTSLIEKPSSGYDLARRFDKSIIISGTRRTSRSTGELARMESAGWIMAAFPPMRENTERIPGAEAGRAELARWAA